MSELIEFLFRHGYSVLFGMVFVEQVGIPIPAAPVLLAAGALTAAGRLSGAVVLLVSVAASLAGDLIWYRLGRSRGHKVLKWICRLTLEPDSCVRRSEDVFAHYRGRALLVAKFIPGLNAAAAPMAGHLGMSLPSFLLYDLAGAFLWAGTFFGIGLLFSAQIEDVALMMARLGSWAIVVAVSALGGYLSWKYLQRRRFLHKLRIARISPVDLMDKIAAGEDVVIIDLRHDLEFESENVRLPGAIHFLPAEVEQRHTEIPRDRDIVLYCT